MMAQIEVFDPKAPAEAKGVASGHAHVG